MNYEFIKHIDNTMISKILM